MERVQKWQMCNTFKGSNLKIIKEKNEWKYTIALPVFALFESYC